MSVEFFGWASLASYFRHLIITRDHRVAERMKRGPVLFFVGMTLVSCSVGIAIAVLASWIFPSFPKGSTVTLDSFMVSDLLIGVLGLAIGIIGGFLTGRNLREFRESIA